MALALPHPAQHWSQTQAYIMELRIESLEIKIMELENTVEELNTVISKQYLIIERLEIAQQIIAKRIESLAITQDPEEQHQLPPH